MPKITPPKLGTRAIFGGTLYPAREYEGWQIAWESHGAHRLWCHQFRAEPKHLVCVVMFNPGSLSGDGAGLAKDDTLRIIRSAMPDTAAALVLNLFTLATPKPTVLFDQWSKRDCSAFKLAPLLANRIDAVVFAYGDGGQDRNECRETVRTRIVEIRAAFRSTPVAELPEVLTSKLGNPKHPKHWKIKELIPTVKAAIARLLAK